MLSASSDDQEAETVPVGDSCYQAIQKFMLRMNKLSMDSQTSKLLKQSIENLQLKIALLTDSSNHLKVE